MLSQEQMGVWGLPCLVEVEDVFFGSPVKPKFNNIFYGQERYNYQT